MEKPTNEERNSTDIPVDIPVDVSKLSPEQQQKGIDANIQAMTEAFIGRLTMLQQLVGRGVNVKVNARLADGRKITIRVR